MKLRHSVDVGDVAGIVAGAVLLTLDVVLMLYALSL